MDRAKIEAEIAARQKLCEAAAELQQLTGPSRAADLHVAMAVGWEIEDGKELLHIPTMLKAWGEETVLNLVNEPNNILGALPRYTSSYDAAYSLAGDETDRRIECGTYKNGSSWAYAHLAQHEEVYTDSVDAFNEPTAITIALLHAHAARLEGQSREPA
jgi:hypothetical protein